MEKCVRSRLESWRIEGRTIGYPIGAFKELCFKYFFMRNTSGTQN